MTTREIQPADSRYPESIQSKINSGKMDFEEYKETKMKDYLLIERKNGTFPKLNGYHIKYISRSLFRSGGIVVQTNYENDYFLYRAYSGKIISLQFSDIDELYGKSPKGKRKRKKNV